MGQKVHPTGYRIGVTKPWHSTWYTNKHFALFLREDFAVRKFVKGKLYSAGVSRIQIDRTANKVRINVFAARPGLAIGKKGAGIEQIRTEISRLLSKKVDDVFLNVTEVRKAETDAQLIAEGIATQIERRVAYKRAMKKSIQQAMKFGVKGIKVRTAGRLAGAEIARKEVYHEGSVPLHTLRANIDYGTAEAKTTYGIIGIKVWVNRGEVDMRNRLGRGANVVPQSSPSAPPPAPAAT